MMHGSTKLKSRNERFPIFYIQQTRQFVGFSGVSRNFFGWGGGRVKKNVEDRGKRKRGSGDVSPLVRGPGGSCNFVQEISFHIVTFS